MSSGQSARRAQTKGFTLIELLIVVAIIAILAAIAVPNFLEAQTRAKVARVNADQRSIATAIEMYAIDFNAAPAGLSEVLDRLGRIGTYGFLTNMYAYSKLTTPVAYMTSVPRDPFDSVLLAYAFLGAPDDFNVYYYESIDWILTKGKNAGNRKFQAAYENSHRWVTWTWGPSKKASFPIAFLKDSNNVNQLYDPTNGTMSKGAVARSSSGIPNK